jgi:hypothetical protein
LRVNGLPGAGKLVLYDVSGRAAARFALASGSVEIKLEGVRPGLYIAEWSNGQLVRRARLVKQ